jgi:hypothetical protein
MLSCGGKVSGQRRQRILPRGFLRSYWASVASGSLRLTRLSTQAESCGFIEKKPDLACSSVDLDRLATRRRLVGIAVRSEVHPTEAFIAKPTGTTHFQSISTRVSFGQRPRGSFRSGHHHRPRCVYSLEGKLTTPGRAPNVLSRFRFGHCVPATDRR